MREQQPVDPYAPPPMKRDGSGAVVRIGVIAVMLAGAVWGFTAFNAQQPDEVALTEPAPVQQQFAENAPVVVSDTAPLAANDPAPAPAAAPAPRRAAPASPAPVEPPAPITTPAPTVTPPAPETTPDPVAPL
ncbi:MAG: hypothetical protein WDM79_05755 [Terricaulis sp.]